MHTQTMAFYRYGNIFCITVSLFLWTCAYEALTAQVVKTFAFVNAPDGLAVDREGNVYGTRYEAAPLPGSIMRVSPDGKISAISTNQSGPADLIFDTQGRLYVSNFNSNSIDRLTASHTWERFASGLSGPLGLAFDADENLYVMNDLQPTIQRIEPEGHQSHFAGIDGFGYGSGLCMGPEGNLYAVSYSHGRVYSINPYGIAREFTRINTSGLAHIIYNKGAFYATSIHSHTVYSIDMNGGVSIFAGTGLAGYVDGSVSEAQFDRPNGITASVSGDTLYVAEHAGRFRMIIMNATTSVADNAGSDILLEQNYPNPFSDRTVLQFVLHKPQYVRLEILDMLGNVIQILVNEYKEAGSYSIPCDSLPVPGPYCYRLQGANGTEARMMLFVD